MTGNRGKVYRLGLFHGERTGHVLMHCNSRIVLIDFNITSSKMYSFFLDDELCEVHIERLTGTNYQYSCTLNREAATPLNEMRKASEKKHWRQALWLGGGLIGFASILAVILTISMRPATPTMLRDLEARGGVRTTARLADDKDKDGLMYSFRAGSDVYYGAVAAADSLTTFGLPLRAGDEFELRYAYEQPRLSYLDLSRPTDQQIERYVRRLAAFQARLHPELKPDQALCQVEAAYQLHGLDGLSRIYYQNQRPITYPGQSDYLKMVESLPFRRLCALPITR